MPALSAPGDTWGITGPDFLRVYLGALVVFFIVAIAIRLSVTRSGGRGTDTRRRPGPSEVALISGGPRQAVYASVAALRAAGAVDVAGKGLLTASGPAPAGGSRLDLAVYDAVQRGVPAAQLPSDVRVKSVLDDLSSTVVHTGWQLEPSARSRARLGGILLLALTAFGVVRVVSGIANQRSVGYLVALCLVTFLAALWFLAVPRLSRSGRAMLAETRARNAHLSPRQSPSWATYGMTGAAMGVALFGTSALFAADPAFAEEVGLRRSAAGGGESGSYAAGGDSSGGGGGGSDGGGGGGGCGGGGCGG